MEITALKQDLLEQLERVGGSTGIFSVPCRPSLMHILQDKDKSGNTESAN